ncbi:hypothetical protein AAVH_25270 [Aphelenchoides avenae]|nr:hypothetical protein AAVH_25270 [Aphelenchus avenae]
MSSFLFACQAVMLLTIISNAKCLPTHKRLCPEGWATYTGGLSVAGSRKCYRVVEWDYDNIDADKEDALLLLRLANESLSERCAAFAGQPASIHDIVENDFVAHLVREAIADRLKAMCKRPDDIECTTPVFARLGCGPWRWADGSDLDFTNYAGLYLLDSKHKVAYDRPTAHCFLNTNPRSAHGNGPFAQYGQWVSGLRLEAELWLAPVGVCELVIENRPHTA